MEGLKERLNFFRLRLEELRAAADMDYESLVLTVNNMSPSIDHIPLLECKDTVTFKGTITDYTDQVNIPDDGPQNHFAVLPTNTEDLKYLFASAGLFLYGDCRFQNELLVRTVCFMVQNETFFTSANVLPVQKILSGNVHFFASTQALEETDPAVKKRFRNYSRVTIDGLFKIEVLTMIERDFEAGSLWQILALQELLSQEVKIWSVFPKGIVEDSERIDMNLLLSPQLNCSSRLETTVFPIFWDICIEACDSVHNLGLSKWKIKHLPLVFGSCKFRMSWKVSVVEKLNQLAIGCRGIQFLRQSLLNTRKRPFESESAKYLKWVPNQFSPSAEKYSKTYDTSLSGNQRPAFTSLKEEIIEYEQNLLGKTLDIENTLYSVKEETSEYKLSLPGKTLNVENSLFSIKEEIFEHDQSFPGKPLDGENNLFGVKEETFEHEQSLPGKTLDVENSLFGIKEETFEHEQSLPGKTLDVENILFGVKEEMFEHEQSLPGKTLDVENSLYGVDFTNPLGHEINTSSSFIKKELLTQMN